MKRHNITLSEPVSEMIRTQIHNGRFKDFSAAIQEASWNYFFGALSPFEEYGTTPEEVATAAQRELLAFRKARKAGKLIRWKPE